MATNDLKSNGEIGPRGIENDFGGVLPAVVALGVGDRRHALLANSGNPNLLVDGSVTPKVFEGGPAAGETWRNVRLRVVIVGGTAWSAGGFGGSVTPPTNGINVEVKGNAVPRALIDNATMLGYAGPGGATWYTSATAGAWVVEWLVANEMRGDASDTVRLTVQDNLTTLGLVIGLAIVAYDA